MKDIARDVALMATMLVVAAEDNNPEAVIRYVNSIGPLLNKIAQEAQNEAANQSK